MPKPPRSVVVGYTWYAKPTRGYQLLYRGASAAVLPFECVLAYHIAPNVFVEGLVSVGSKRRMLPCTSDQPVLASYRRPRFNVSFGVNFQSSCTNPDQLFSRPPYSD